MISDSSAATDSQPPALYRLGPGEAQLLAGISISSIISIGNRLILQIRL
jgi:hypothetical protein